MRLNTIANNTFLPAPDFIIVIKEIMIPAIKITGEKINVSKIRFSAAII
jgi:hypothetical protein